LCVFILAHPTITIKRTAADSSMQGWFGTVCNSSQTNHHHLHPRRHRHLSWVVAATVAMLTKCSSWFETRFVVDKGSNARIKRFDK
jgi:hypothetical protein